MAQPVELPDDLVLDARLTGEASNRSIAGQVEHWVKLGRAVEALMRAPDALALKGRGDALQLSVALSSTDTAEGRARLAAHLTTLQYPHFEPAPDQPGLLVKIDEDGTRTRGRFVRRVFTPAEK
jgi:hypothetical protein